MTTAVNIPLLQSLLSGLGCNNKETSQYQLGDEWVECLLDLRTLLRHYHRQSISTLQIVESLNISYIITQHLVPILLQHGHGNFSISSNNTCIYLMSGKSKLIARNVLELLVALTWPFHLDPAINGDSCQQDLSKNYPLVSHLTLCKKLFCTRQFLDTIFNLLTHSLLLKSNPDSYQSTMIQLILLLLRNISYMPCLHSKWISSLSEYRIIELLSQLSCELSKYHQWAILLLELCYSIWCGVDPTISLDDNHDDINITLDKKISNSRARLGGILSETLSTGQQIILYQKYNNNSNYLDEKKKIKHWKRPLYPIFHHHKDLKSDFKPFQESSKMFLFSGAFNNLISTTLKTLSSEQSHILFKDHVQLTQLVYFFFKFSRVHLKQDVNSVISSLKSLFTDEFSQYWSSKMNVYNMDKCWYELYCLVSMLKEYLHVIGIMITSTKSSLAYQILDKLLSDHSKVNMLIQLTKTYSTQPIDYLRTLVELDHLLVKLFEQYCRHVGIVTMKKKKKQKSETLVNKETGMKLSEFESMFACESVISKYMLLLESGKWRYESEQIKHYIVRMFHRLVSHNSYIPMFFKASYLIVWNDILLNGPSLKGNEEIITFSKFIAHKFIKALQSYPLLIVDAFYPKNWKDCQRIQRGKEQILSNDIVTENNNISLYDDISIETLLYDMLTESKSDRIQWICDYIQRIIDTEQNALLPGLVFDQQESEIRTLRRDVYSEISHYFDDPHFCQLLMRLGMYQDLHQWKVPAELTIEELSNKRKDLLLLVEAIGDQLNEDKNDHEMIFTKHRPNSLINEDDE